MPVLLEFRSVSGDLRVRFRRLRGDFVTITLLSSLASRLGRFSLRIVSRGRYTWDGISVCRDQGFGTLRLNRPVFRSDTSVGAREDFEESGVGGRGRETVSGKSEGSISISLSEGHFFFRCHHRRFFGASTFSGVVFHGTEPWLGVGALFGRRQRRYCISRTTLLRCNIIDARKLTGTLSVPSPLNTKSGKRRVYYQDRWY